MASVIFWCYDTYIYYSMCIVVISAYSIIHTLIQTRQVNNAGYNINLPVTFSVVSRMFSNCVQLSMNLIVAWGCESGKILRMFERSLPSFSQGSFWHEEKKGTLMVALFQISMMTRELVAESNADTVTVSLVDGETVKVPSQDLVPGDTIVIPPHGCIMTCDALLLTGNCIVNESVLTGESVPVMKSLPAYVDEVYDPQATHSRHTLYRGTRVLQSRYYDNNQVLALVVRTGSDTANGQLVRSILFPKNYGFHLYHDSIKFLFLMSLIAVLGMCCSIYLYTLHGVKLSLILS
ncbi:hypothetical protein J6590_021690 [Homalodisca vitripennis]|nr:hypothetical protein J6590_021690 [Homalodisca vitripennis]